MTTGLMSLGSRLLGRSTGTAPLSAPLDTRGTGRFGADAWEPSSGASIQAESAPLGQIRQLEAQLTRIRLQLDALLRVPAPAAPILRPSPPTVASPIPGPMPTSFTVRPGDSLARIAAATLGNPDRWPEIYALNQAVIGANPGIIQPGMVLVLPGGATPSPVSPVPLPGIAADLTAREIARALGAPLANVETYWPLVARALAAEGITSRAAIIAAVATIGVETGRFEPIPEYASGEAYQGRPDLDNMQPGDGQRFKGRGFIQLTGRANYRAYGEALGVDLVNNPDLALDPEIAARVLARYFKTRGIAEMADRGDWEAVRKAVNGGLNGWDRFQNMVRALAQVA